MSKARISLFFGILGPHSWNQGLVLGPEESNLVSIHSPPLFIFSACKIDQISSSLTFSFGILGAFLETLSIYLLANLITNLDIEKSNFQFKYLEIILLNKNTIIIIFLLSAVFSALIYYFSNKYIIKAKCKIERFVREEITDLTLNIKWEYFLKSYYFFLKYQLFLAPLYYENY